MTGRQIDVFGYVEGGKRGVRRDRPRRYSNFTCRTAGLFNYPTRGQPASFFFCTQVSAHKSGSGVNIMRETYPSLRLTRDNSQ